MERDGRKNTGYRVLLLPFLNSEVYYDGEKKIQSGEGDGKIGYKAGKSFCAPVLTASWFPCCQNDDFFLYCLIGNGMAGIIYTNRNGKGGVVCILLEVEVSLLVKSLWVGFVWSALISRWFVCCLLYFFEGAECISCLSHLNCLLSA